MLFEDLPEPTAGLHDCIQDKSAQKPVESGHAPRPIARGVEDDTQRDVAPDSETQGEYEPLAYHQSTGHELLAHDRHGLEVEKMVEARLPEFWRILSRSR